MAVLTIKRVDALLEIVRADLPRMVVSDGDFEDWHIIGPALVSIVADLFEGIVASIPPRARLRADVLARSLAEHAIAFAWLAGPEQGRSVRIRQLLRDEFVQRSKAANKLEKEIAGRAAYAALFDATQGSGAPLPKTLLDERARSRLRSLEEDLSIKALPSAFDMAFAADAHWMPQVDMVQHNPYALIYFTLFTGPSFSTHPSISAVARMVAGQPPNLAVGAAEALGESESPYGQAYLTLINTLLVASGALGWPREDAIREALHRE